MSYVQEQPSRAAHNPGEVTVELPVGAVLAHWRRQGRCPAIPHVGVVRSGTLAVRMPAGHDKHFAAGDTVLLGPDQDAWTIGQCPCVLSGFTLTGD